MINFQRASRVFLSMGLFGMFQLACHDASLAATAIAASEGPTINDRELVERRRFEIIFESRFSSSRGSQPDPSHWRREDMGKSGNAGNHRQAEGRRHAAWYDDYHELTAFVRGDHLVQRGYIADKDTPGFISRDSGGRPRNHAYDDPDPRDRSKGTINFSDFEFYTSWLDTFALKPVKGGQVPVLPTDELVARQDYWGQPGKTDTPSPNIKFSPGTFFEIEVNFEGMEAIAHRHSFWLMPAMSPGVTYDDDPANGVEIDIYEHEIALEKELADGLSPNPNDVLLMKCIGGRTSPQSTQNLLRDDGKAAINVPGINVGWHKIGLLWTRDELVWFVDGEATVRDTQLVPQVDMYVIISREANTGAKHAADAGPHELATDGKRIPHDAGLFGRNAVTPTNRELIKAGKDEVKVRSVRAWKILPQDN